MADGRGHREYRMAELAREAGITVRTVRFYRERGLIAPPRREGRIAWYDGNHLARLRTITALLERGHTLNGIADLATAFETGRGVGEVLGLGGAPGEETPVRHSPEEPADRSGAEVTPENLTTALALGHPATDGTDGTEIIHLGRHLLDASAALVREGIPLAKVLEAGGRARVHTEALAEIFASVIRERTTTTTVAELRPLAQSVVAAELSLALDRHLRNDNDRIRNTAD
ncbi:MerR family transcriptional regulator [Streptomyces sp. NPDC087658]|uniref:MerR family transcriptional regulator n=1 Tax=Streptomyces sp. NPDC087658 TaxID=3365800 RepID=UPI003824A3F0